MSTARGRGAALGVLALAVCLAPLFTTAPALAHAPPQLDGGTGAASAVEPAAQRPAEHNAANATPSATPLAVALAGLAGAALALRSRPARIAALVLLLSVLAVESGVHSVHHLGSDAGPARCSIAQATSHLLGLHVAPAALSGAPLCLAAAAAPAVAVVHRRTLYRPDPGRAPPLPPLPV